MRTVTPTVPFSKITPASNMSAPEGNQFAAKADTIKINRRKPVLGTDAEVRAWNRAQARSGLNWNTWARAALNSAAK